MSKNVKLGTTTYLGIDTIQVPDVTEGVVDSFIDTTDANAVANDIVTGKTAYVNGTKVTGNITSKTAQTYTPTTTNQTITSGQYLSGNQTILGDANLVAGNIKKDVSIFGVTGTHEGGSGELDTYDIPGVMRGYDIKKLMYQVSPNNFEAAKEFLNLPIYDEKNLTSLEFADLFGLERFPVYNAVANRSSYNPANTDNGVVCSYPLLLFIRASGHSSLDLFFGKIGTDLDTLQNVEGKTREEALNIVSQRISVYGTHSYYTFITGVRENIGIDMASENPDTLKYITLNNEEITATGLATVLEYANPIWYAVHRSLYGYKGNSGDEYPVIVQNLGITHMPGGSGHIDYADITMISSQNYELDEGRHNTRQYVDFPLSDDLDDHAFGQWHSIFSQYYQPTNINDYDWFLVLGLHHFASSDEPTRHGIAVLPGGSGSGSGSEDVITAVVGYYDLGGAKDNISGKAQTGHNVVSIKYVDE